MQLQYDTILWHRDILRHTKGLDKKKGCLSRMVLIKEKEIKTLRVSNIALNNDRVLNVNELR